MGAERGANDRRGKPGGSPFVTRAGIKLAAALDAFGIDPTGRVCADLGSHTGGFVDCLLQRGAARVYAVDTAYGTLAWKLRRDPRVVVFERTNALHFVPPEPVSLVTIDVGWTRQRLILESARRMLDPTRPDSAIVTLIKPHYEAKPERREGGVLRDEWYDPVLREVLASIPALGLRVVETLESPIRGHGGNREVLAHIVGLTSGDFGAYRALNFESMGTPGSELFIVDNSDPASTPAISGIRGFVFLRT